MPGFYIFQNDFIFLILLEILKKESCRDRGGNIEGILTEKARKF